MHDLLFYAMIPLCSIGVGAHILFYGLVGGFLRRQFCAKCMLVCTRLLRGKYWLDTALGTVWSDVTYHLVNSHLSFYNIDIS